MRVVPGETLTDAALDEMRRSLKGYLHGLEVTIERVDDIPATKAGKRRTVIVET